MDLEYAQLSRDARLNRIGELCSKAVTLYLLDQTESTEMHARQKLESQALNNYETTNLGIEMTEDTKDILMYVKRVGPASPTEICSQFELSRTTAFRRLKTLCKLGLVRKIGKTSSVQYVVTSALPENTRRDITTVCSNYPLGQVVHDAKGLLQDKMPPHEQIQTSKTVQDGAFGGD